MQFFIFQSLRFCGFLLSLQSIMDRMGWRIKTSGYGSDKPFDIHKQRTVEGVVHEEPSYREVLLGGVQQVEGYEARHFAISRHRGGSVVLWLDRLHIKEAS